MGHASAVDPNAPSSPLVDPLPFTRPLKPSVYPQFYKKTLVQEAIAQCFKKASIKKKENVQIFSLPKAASSTVHWCVFIARLHTCLQTHDRLPLLHLPGRDTFPNGVHDAAACGGLQ